jgi:hypothetical protein
MTRRHVVHFPVRIELRMKVLLGPVLALLLLCACVTQHPASPVRSAAGVTSAVPAEAAVSRASAELKHALSLAGASEWADADRVLRDLVDSDQFPQLTLTEQHVALGLAAAAAVNTREPQRGLSLIQRACAMAETDARDWFIRLAAANAAGNAKEAAFALTTLAERWPQNLARAQDDEQIERAMFHLNEVDSDSDRYALLSALHRVGFARELNGASIWWRDFALLQLARGEPASAVQTLARINDPRVAISIWADKRFDVVRSEFGGQLQIAAVAQRSIRDAMLRVQDSPNLLKPMNRLAYLLVDLLQFQQALQVTDSAIERQDTRGPAAWSDYDREYPRTLETRAQALSELGRGEAALTQFEAASRVESGADKVSQIIDLAEAYNEAGRPREATETLQRVPPQQASPFGVMAFRLEQFWADLQLHNQSAADRALAFLREHQDDAVSLYQEALLYADLPDEGATLLISRLADEKRRSAALEAVQSYSGVEPPLLLETHRRWQALIDRPDVHQEILRVGRVDRYALLRGGY